MRVWFALIIPIYLLKYMKHTAEYNPLYRSLAHTHINFA